MFYLVLFLYILFDWLISHVFIYFFQEDPRSSALQRQLSEVDRWLRGQAHKLATAQEALAVQELVEAMLVGQSVTALS